MKTSHVGSVKRRVAIALPVAAILFLAAWFAVDSESDRTTRSGASDLVSASRSTSDADSESQPATAGKSVDPADLSSDSILVLDASTRAPIEGALVVATIEEGDDEYEYVDERELRLRTDGRGVCVTKEEGGVDLVVYALGYSVGRVHTTAPRAVTVLLARDNRRTVIAVNVFSKPLSDAVASPDGAPELTVSADAQGRVTIGEGRWDIGAPGYTSRSVGGRSDRYVLHEAYTMAGRVLDSSGNPVPDVALRTGGSDKTIAVSDAEGRFTVTGLNTGIHFIVFHKEGYAYTDVELWAGERDATVVLYHAASVQCIVIGLDGRPAHGSEVWMPWRGDKEGPDVLFGKFQPGEYEIRAELDEARCDTTVTLSEGEHRVVSLVLKNPEICSQIRVRVRDFEGRPVANALVWHHSIRALTDRHTDSKGEATLDLFDEVGTYAEIGVGVSPSLAGIAAARTLKLPSVALDSSSEPVVVQLARLVPLELEFVDAHGQPVVPHQVRVGRDHVIATGTHTWLVPDDKQTSVSVYMRDDRFAPIRVLEGLKPGRHRIVLHPTLIVVGRAVDPEGRPLRVADLDARVPGLFSLHQLSVSEIPFTRQFEIFGLDKRCYLGQLRIYLTLGNLPAAVLDLELRAGHNVDLGKVVVREPVRLRGLVHDRDGAPLAGVSILPLPDFYDVHRGYSSRADGTFDILESGLVTHFVIAKQGHGALLVPVASLKGVRLRAPGTLVIDGKKRRLGWPRADGTVLWNEWGFPKRYDVAPGRYVVEIEDADGKKKQHDITVAVGETVRVGKD